MKTHGDFVKRSEKYIVLLEEGNLARVDQDDAPLNGPVRNKKIKICSSCAYAKVMY
jgi:hypothetical protein